MQSCSCLKKISHRQIPVLARLYRQPRVNNNPSCSDCWTPLFLEFLPQLGYYPSALLSHCTSMSLLQIPTSSLLCTSDAFPQPFHKFPSLKYLYKKNYLTAIRNLLKCFTSYTFHKRSVCGRSNIKERKITNTEDKQETNSGSWI